MHQPHLPHIPPGSRYPVLRTLAILWLVSAALALIFGVYQAVCYAANLRMHEVSDFGDMDRPVDRIAAVFICLAMTFFVVVVDVAVAELIKLAIDLEHRTRITATQFAALAQAAPAPSVTAERGNMATTGHADEESAEAALIRGH
jgi:hypothetical protein